MKKLLIASASLFVSSLVSSQAMIVWTGLGATDDFYDAANWDFTGSGSAAVASPTDDAMIITSATISEPSAAFSNIEIGDGQMVTFDATAFTFTNNNGFSGVNDVGDVTSVLNLINGSSLNAQFMTIGLVANVDASSTLLFRGGGDPINSQTEQVFINLEPGAMLVLPTVAEFTEQGADIYVNGVSFASDPSILSFNGTTATAVPEPSGMALVGLAGIAMIMRRRK